MTVIEPNRSVHGVEVPIPLGDLGAIFQNTQLGRDSMPKRTPWKDEAAKANHGLATLLESKAEVQEVVALDNYVQPVDRGPADVQRYLRTWQYQVTGKVATAAVLADVKAEHIKHGGPAGIHALASKYISEHKLDDTFYIVDLGNVLRMFKARCIPPAS